MIEGLLPLAKTALRPSLIILSIALILVAIPPVPKRLPVPPAAPMIFR